MSLVTHPANQTWPELAEIFQVKVSNSWVQFPTDEEIIQRVSLTERQSITKKHTQTLYTPQKNKETVNYEHVIKLSFNLTIHVSIQT